MTTLEKALMPLIWRTIDLLEKQGGPEVRAIVREITSLLRKKEDGGERSDQIQEGALFRHQGRPRCGGGVPPHSM
jgi:hypothetical protein